MKIQDILHEAAATLRETVALEQVEVLEEIKGEATQETKVNVAKSKKLAAVVGFGGFTPTIQGSTTPSDGKIFGVFNMTVSVFENPTVNQSKPGAITLLEVASVVANELSGAACEGMESPLAFKQITPATIAVLPGNVEVTTCDVVFETKTSLG